MTLAVLDFITFLRIQTLKLQKKVFHHEERLEITIRQIKYNFDHTVLSL